MNIMPINNNQYNNRPNFGTRLDGSLKPILEKAKNRNALKPERLEQVKEVMNNGLEGRISFEWLPFINGSGKGTLLYEDPVLDKFYRFAEARGDRHGYDYELFRSLPSEGYGEEAQGAIGLWDAYGIKKFNRNRHELRTDGPNIVGQCWHQDKSYLYDEFFDAVNNKSIKNLHDAVEKVINKFTNIEVEEASRKAKLQKGIDELF